MPDLVAVALAAPDLLPVLDAAWADGDAVLPIDPALPDPARQRLLAALRPARLVTAAGVQPCPEPVDVASGTALVIATSGSTGDPKGVLLSRAALSASNAGCLQRIGAQRGERWLCCLPLHHVAGLQVVLRSRALGRAAVVHPRFDVPAVAAAVADGDAAHLSLVPTQLSRLLDAGVDLSACKTVLLGGAAVPPALLGRARRRGVPVVTTYGMTETCGGCVYDGVALDGVEVSIDADGRIRIDGPVLFDGYRLRPEATAAVRDRRGLRTSDLGRVGGDGRLEVLGRADDIIVSGGHKVPAAEVAALLRAHPGVADAAVFGHDDPDWGQRVVAAVVPSDPGHPPTLEALRAHISTRTAGWKAPRQLLVVDALPRTALGKLDRGALRRRVG